MSCSICLALGAGSTTDLHAAALAVLDNPRMPLDILKRNTFFGIKDQ
jgi:hypothetical protein